MLANIRDGKPAQINIIPISQPRIWQWELDQGLVVSGIGHPATRDMLTRLLEVDLPLVDPSNRAAVNLKSGDLAYISQYIGPRLKEGEILTNPDPANFTWLQVEL